MRSALLDECFTNEEREFLHELIEPAIPEGEVTLQIHRDDVEKADGPDDAIDHLAMEQRQKRRLQFLQTLYQCLQEEDNGDHT